MAHGSRGARGRRRGAGGWGGFGGGMHGGETAFAHLYLRLMIDASVQTKTSFTVCFFDVVAAFAQMLRRIVFNTDAGDEAWLASLAAAGFSEEDIKSVYDNICSTDWVKGMLDGNKNDVMNSCIPSDFRYAEQSFNNSWVSQEHIPNIMCVTKGSGVGTPLADLVYGMAMSRVFLHLRKCMGDQNINSTMKIGDVMHQLVDVSFADDVAIPVTAPAEQIIYKCSRVVCCVCDVFKIYGMTLNFKPG